MPTNKQRREAAKRKLERQLERRAQQAKRRQMLRNVGIGLGAAAVIAAVVVAVVVSKDDNKGNTSASSTPSSATSSGAPGLPPVQLGNAAPMPEFKAPANLGANCQYPADKAAPASKPVKPPRTGKVPTEPAQVSASMATNQGNIGLMLANNKAPCTVNSFASLTNQHFFNDTKCHRLTTGPSLSVLQCGDPKGDGTGGPGYQFGNEYPTNQYPPNDPNLKQPVIYPRGTIAMANTGQPNSNSSQFFLVYRDSALPPEYTVFGTIQADGLATLDKIAAAGVAGGGDDGTPNLEVTITSLLLD